MTCLKYALAAGSLVALVGSTSPGFAQNPQCACTAPLSGGVTGQIVSASGEVLSSQPLGLGDANAGTPVGLGSQVVTGANSSALVVVGGCSVPVGANSELVISEAGGNMCVQVTEVGVPPPATNVLPVIAGVGAVGAVVGIAAIGGGDDGASP